MKDPKFNRSNGIGASVKRLEDDRYLRGKGRFVGDIRLQGMLDIAFVRSPLAHANIKNIQKPEGFEESVFICEDLISVRGIKADSGLPGFKSSVQPILASKKVRHVGEPVVACVAAPATPVADIDVTPAPTCFGDRLPVGDFFLPRRDLAGEPARRLLVGDEPPGTTGAVCP